MKRGKPLTAAQKKALSFLKLNPKDWMVISWGEGQVKLRHKTTDEVRAVTLPR